MVFSPFLSFLDNFPHALNFLLDHSGSRPYYNNNIDSYSRKANPILHVLSNENLENTDTLTICNPSPDLPAPGRAVLFIIYRPS
jgi:hypothetical protein